MDSEISEAPRSYGCPVTWKYALGCALFIVPWTILTHIIWPLLILEPHYTAGLYSKAKGTPEPTDPRLTFFHVPYDQEMREINPFIVDSLRDCRGSFP